VAPRAVLLLQHNFVFHHPDVSQSG